MQIATLRDGTDRPGAKTTFDSGRFMIDGQDAVMADEIIWADA